MAGYTRFDVTNQIADTNVINAAPLNGEFDAVEAAFNVASGHRHDGTSAEGAPITVVGPAQDIVVTATLLRPKTDNTVDLGTSSLEFKDLWVDGIANIDSLVADTADIKAGTINATVIGATTPAAATVTSLTATSGTVGGSAITTAANTQTVTNKTINLASNTLVATSAQLASAITDETGTGAIVFSGSPALTGTPTAPTAASATNTTQIATTAHVFAERSNAATLQNKTLVAPVINTANINDGTIDNVLIGSVVPAAGAFTTLAANSATVAGASVTTSTNTQTLTNKTLTSPVITGGTIDGIAPATISGTQTLTNKTINLTNNTLVATSAQLAAAVTDETGTGALVFAGSPALTGTPTAPTAAAATNTTQLATTAHVFAERTNTATLTNKTIDLANNTLTATSAQLAAAITDETGTGAIVFAGSPALTGAPTAPTAAAATNTTQLATTAHVFAERTNTATLTNKTLTSPVITGGSISSLLTPLATASGGTGLATMPANTIFGNFTGSAAAPAPIDMATLRTMQGWSQSLSGNGYVVYPGGMILQYFSTGAAGSGVNGSVTFPTTFPNACTVVLTQMANTGGDEAVGDNYIAQVRAVSASGFTIRNLGPASRIFFCMAVGY